jgi:hypothetical protein
MPRTTLALLAGALACNGPAADGGFASSSPGPASAAATSTGPSAASSSGVDSTSTSTSGDSTAAEPLRDLGSPDFGPDKPAGCKGKIDFLFLISRLSQMDDEQQRLVSSFPGFIDTIETMFPDFDVHIMVANPDGTWPGWACEKYACTQDAFYCGEHGEGYTCGPASTAFATECDATLGAGITFNAGPYAANKPCTLAGGRRYITNEEPDILSAFECIATVGTLGLPPPTGDALIAALSPYFAVGECNKGFLRDDALLFLTFISDLEDDYSKTYVSDWYKAVVKAKHGDPDAVVNLLVTAFYSPVQIDGCTTSNNHENKLRDLVTMFPYNVVGDLCAPSYAPYFEAAAKLVDEACASFVPQ